MTDVTLISTGVIILALITVAYGGSFLVRVTTGSFPTNELQRSYFRAGHAHAGMLIVLGLVLRLFLHLNEVPEWSRLLGDFVLFAAILMPAGFFLSVVGKDPKTPNRLRVLIWIGAASLTVGLLGAGIGLIVAGTTA